MRVASKSRHIGPSGFVQWHMRLDCGHIVLTDSYSKHLTRQALRCSLCPHPANASGRQPSERNLAMWQANVDGQSIASIARAYGITATRVQQIVARVKTFNRTSQQTR